MRCSWCDMTITLTLNHSYFSVYEGGLKSYFVNIRSFWDFDVLEVTAYQTTDDCLEDLWAEYETLE